MYPMHYNDTNIMAQNSLDLKEKADYYKQIQTILCEEAGSAFIQVPPITIAMKQNLGGYKFYPIYVQDMSTVYWTK